MTAAAWFADQLEAHAHGVIDTAVECSIVRSGRRPTTADRLAVAACLDTVLHGSGWHARRCLVDAYADWLVEAAHGVEVA